MGIINKRNHGEEKKMLQQRPYQQPAGYYGMVQLPACRQGDSRENGHDAREPHGDNVGHPVEIPWIVHMVKDILLLLTCSCAYFQEGWERSRGARWEFKVACWTGKDIYVSAEKKKHTY